MGSELTPKTQRRIKKVFTPEDWERAEWILIRECGENIPGWESAGLERLRFAVLKLSQGEMSKLEQMVNLAKRDFRDVLMAAGFGEPESYKLWLRG